MRRHRLLSVVQVLAGLPILSALAWAWHAETHIAPAAVPRPALHARIIPLAVPVGFLDPSVVVPAVAIAVDDRLGRAYVTLASIPLPTPTSTPAAGGTETAAMPPTIDNRLYLVDTRAGRVLRGLHLFDIYPSAVAVATPSGQLYMTERDTGSIHILDGQHSTTLGEYSGLPGASVWRTREWAFSASIANPADSAVYTASAALAGRLQGALALPGLPAVDGSLYLDHFVVDSRLHAVFAAAGTDTVSNHGAVALFNLGDGTLRYMVPMDREPCEMALDPSSDVLAVLVTDDYCAGGGRTKLIILDARTGHVRHTVSIAGTFASIAAVRGHLFVMTKPDQQGSAADQADARSLDGAALVSMVDLGSGAVVPTVSTVRGTATMAVDEHRGLVFIAATDWTVECSLTVEAGQLRVLAAGSGEELGRVAIGSTPLAMAVDSRAGRLLVVGSGVDTHDGSCYGRQSVPPSLSIVDLRSYQVAS